MLPKKNKNPSSYWIQQRSHSMQFHQPAVCRT